MQARSLREQNQDKDRTSRRKVHNSLLGEQAINGAHEVNTLVLEYIFHAYGRTEGICGICITDQEYPKLVAHQVLSKVVDEFLAKYPRSAYADVTKDNIQYKSFPFPELADYIRKYQDPQQADSIMKIQKELDETKIVLHKTIESVLERGEKIDNLVAKSDGLSAQSKMFYTQVRISLWPEQTKD